MGPETLARLKKLAKDPEFSREFSNIADSKGSIPDEFLSELTHMLTVDLGCGGDKFNEVYCILRLAYLANGKE